MKVKCIKTSIDNPSSSVINGDMKEYLLIGTMFWVFGVRFFKGETYIYIFNEEHLFEVPLELFSVVDDSMSSEWRMKVWENREIAIWPELFYCEDFFENFAERDNKEREMFKDLRIKIEM